MTRCEENLKQQREVVPNPYRIFSRVDEKLWETVMCWILLFQENNSVLKLNDFPHFLYKNLDLSYTLVYSICYCYTSHDMADQFFSFQIQLLHESFSSVAFKPTKTMQGNCSTEALLPMNTWALQNQINIQNCKRILQKCTK